MFCRNTTRFQSQALKVAITLKPQNINRLTTVDDPAAKPWILTFMRMPLDTNHPPKRPCRLRTPASRTITTTIMASAYPGDRVAPRRMMCAARPQDLLRNSYKEGDKELKSPSGFKIDWAVRLKTWQAVFRTQGLSPVFLQWLIGLDDNFRQITCVFHVEQKKKW